MPRKPKAIVMDSWAAIAFLEDETSAQQVGDIIASANEQGIPLYMTAVNLGETWYISARKWSDVDADQAVVEIIHAGIQTISADWEISRSAAVYKSKHKMSYADCFSAALAKKFKADLVTGDPEFKQVENEINIVWLKT